MAERSERQHPRGSAVGAAGEFTQHTAGSLTAKLAVCVIALGLVGSGLLSTRQSRLQAGHEVTSARLRIRAHDERLLRLRADIAALVSPSAVREMMAKRGGMEDFTPAIDRLAPLPDAVDRLELIEELGIGSGTDLGSVISPGSDAVPGDRPREEGAFGR